MIKNICKNCGKEYEYEPKKGTYKFQYCSIECRNEFNKKDKEPQFRICEHCGKEYWWDGNVLFYGEQGNKVDTKKFCCYECGIAYKERKRKISNLVRNGRESPFQDKELMQKVYEKKKSDGTLFISKGEKEMIFYIADTHFGHANILRLNNRPLSISGLLDMQVKSCVKRLKIQK